VKQVKNITAAVISLAAILFIIYKSVAVYLGITLFEGYVYWTGIMTLVWFVIAPIWLWKR